MKKYAAAALLCALFLSGCTPQAEPGTTTVPPTETTEQPTTTAPPQQSAPWDRDDVIDRNLTMEGTWSDTGAWAAEWARDCLPETGGILPEVEFAEGFVLESSCLEQGWSAGVSTWRVFFGSVEARVQLLHFTEGSTTALSGVFPEGSMITTQAALYDALQLDSRIALRLRAFPENELSPNVTELKLSAHGVVNGQRYLLAPDGTLAVLDAVYNENQGTWSLYLIDSATGDLIKKEELGILDYADMEHAGDALLVTLGSADKTEQRVYQTKGGFKPAEPQTGEYRLPGGRMIIERDGSLYAKNSAGNDEKLLVQGVKTDDERVRNYRFFAAVDEERFIYYGWGYEFPLAGGICNSVTGEVTSYDIPEEQAARTPVLYTDGMLFTITADAGISPVPAVTDVKTGTTRHIVLDRTIEPGQMLSVAFSPDGSRTAILLAGEQNAYEVCVYDSRSGAKTVDATLKTPFCSLSMLEYAKNGTLLVTGSRHAGGESAVYIIAPEAR